MAYTNAFVTHFRAVQEWGRRAEAAIHLDVLSFEMEVKCRGRYMTLNPQFMGVVNGRLANTRSITPQTAGFVGWLPYKTLSYELGGDKPRFKQLISAAGLKTPKMWTDQEGAAPEADFILKRSSGSFGYEILGPYRAGRWPRIERAIPGRGTVFAETFVPGRAIKVWYWGARPFFAHISEPAQVHGDGSSTVRELSRARLQRAGQDFEGHPERTFMEAYLSFQNLDLDDVPAAGSSFALDYRYGREFAERVNSLQSDDRLAELNGRSREAVDLAGKCFAAALRETIPVPVLYTIDGILDDDNLIWWIEANSNPALPPDGYKVMFADLFGV